MLREFSEELLGTLKTLVRSRPPEMLAAVLTMALGCCGVITAFTVVNGVLLRPLPYPEPQQLVAVWNEFSQLGLPRLELSEPELIDFREQASFLQDIAATYVVDANVTGGGGPERLRASLTSASLFRLSGLEPVQGRSFAADEDQRGGPRVAVISYRLWQRRYGGSAGAIGEVLSLNSIPHEIIGVMPGEFQLPAGVDLWLPLRLDTEQPARRSEHLYEVFARLAPGVNFDQANSQMRVIGERLQSEYPNYYPADSGWGSYLVPLLDEVTGDSRPALLVLLAAGTLVLLIACANMANLFLARAVARTRDTAIQVALGCGARRIAMRGISESIVVSLAGAGLGLLIASLLLDAFLKLFHSVIPRADMVQLDRRSLIFTLLLPLATGLLLGVLTGLQGVKRNLVTYLKEGGEKSMGGVAKGRLRKLVIVIETALGLILVSAAVLLARGYLNLQRVDPGFSAPQVLTLQLNLPTRDYREDTQLNEFYRRLLEQVNALPTVDRAGLIDYLPLGGIESSGSYYVPERTTAEGEIAPEADIRVISSGYLESMGLELIQGRDFAASDDTTAGPVAIIDQNLARKVWPDQDPLGRQINRQGLDAAYATVIGVVKSVRNSGLDVTSREQLYLPFEQQPSRSVFLAVRSHIEPGTIVESIRRQVMALDPNLPIFDIQTMSNRVDSWMLTRRFSTLLLGLLALLAVLLAAAGVYSLLSYMVARRQREIGLRLALGGLRRDIFRLILGEAGKLALLGIACGVVGTLLLSGFLTSLIYGLSATDPLTLVISSVLLILVALGASFLPAWRATRIDPMVSIREAD